MNCPDCDREVRGRRCRCGWIAQGAAQTAHEPGEPAHVTAHGTQTIADLKRLLAGHFGVPSKQWARDLLARPDISPTQRELARAALNQRALPAGDE